MENRNRTISIIYLICGIVCAVRAILNVAAGQRGLSVLLLVMAIVFLGISLLYRRKD